MILFPCFFIKLRCSSCAENQAKISVHDYSCYKLRQFIGKISFISNAGGKNTGSRESRTERKKILSFSVLHFPNSRFKKKKTV